MPKHFSLLGGWTAGVGAAAWAATMGSAMAAAMAAAIQCELFMTQISLG